MNNPRLFSRRLARQIASLVEQSLPYLAAGDPSRPPPLAVWTDAFRREPVARPPRRATENADTCAAGASFCCGACT